MDRNDVCDLIPAQLVQVFGINEVSEVESRKYLGHAIPHDPGGGSAVAHPARRRWESVQVTAALLAQARLQSGGKQGAWRALLRLAPLGSCSPSPRQGEK